MDWSASDEKTGQWRQSLEEVFAELLALRSVFGGITPDASSDTAVKSQTRGRSLSNVERAIVFFKTTNWRKELNASRRQDIYNLVVQLAVLVLLAVFGTVFKIFSGFPPWVLILIVLALIAMDLAQHRLAGAARARMAQILSTAGLYELWLASLARGPEFFRDLQQQQIPWTQSLFGARSYPAKLRPAVRFMITKVEWFASQPRLKHNVKWIGVAVPFIPMAFMLATIVFHSPSASYYYFTSMMLIAILFSAISLTLASQQNGARMNTGDNERILLTYLIEHLCNQLQRDNDGVREALLPEQAS
jgi:hypothetical protein